jgi:NhaP-type Na+/H+ or K+/H+ antiporter
VAGGGGPGRRARLTKRDLWPDREDLGASSVVDVPLGQDLLLLLVFAGALLLAVLISARAHRTVLSTAVLFLVVGIAAGDGSLGLIRLQADDPIVYGLAQAALFAVLFTDGMRVGWADLRTAWRLPGRALLLGMPLTMALTAALAWWLTDLGLVQCLLLGAVLAPTDPVFAAALVGNRRVPQRLRQMLNVESGLNDGLALPFVIILLEVASHEELHIGGLLLELLLGVVIGVAVPWLVLRLERSRVFESSDEYVAITAVAIALLVLGLCALTQANLFLAAFTAGITVATHGAREAQAFRGLGDLVAELLKLAALLVFGLLISPPFLAEIPFAGWVFAVLALVLARPVALLASFARSGLGGREQAAAMWFGPKGFASVVYGLLVLRSGVDSADTLFHLIALTITLSIIAHSSTDVVVARAFDEPTEVPAWVGPAIPDGADDGHGAHAREVPPEPGLEDDPSPLEDRR